MLSVCIPTYNYDVRPLVHEVYSQASRLLVNIEIIVVDDASTDDLLKTQNQRLIQLDKVRLVELKENMGRSKIRNLLSHTAQFDTLLFLDCDTMPCHSDFLEQYIKVSDKAKVAIGGIAYHDHLSDSRFRLRWEYGHQREICNVIARQQNPYRSFMTGNFLISKDVFNFLHFDETISRYGHEDTLFGIGLRSREIGILHFYNPVFHEGLEDGATFLAKTCDGIDNLKLLVATHPLAKCLPQEIKVLQYYLLLKRLRLSWMIAWIFRFFKMKITRQLLSDRPSMFLFDLYKLGYICQRI